MRGYGHNPASAFTREEEARASTAISNSTLCHRQAAIQMPPTLCRMIRHLCLLGWPRFLAKLFYLYAIMFPREAMHDFLCGPFHPHEIDQGVRNKHHHVGPMTVKSFEVRARGPRVGGSLYCTRQFCVNTGAAQEDSMCRQCRLDTCQVNRTATGYPGRLSRTAIPAGCPGRLSRPAIHYGITWRLITTMPVSTH